MRGLPAAASGLVAPVAFAAVAAAAAVFAAGTATVRVQSAVQWGMQSCSNASSVVRERGALLYTICDGWFVLTPAAVRCIIRMRMDTYMYTIRTHARAHVFYINSWTTTCLRALTCQGEHHHQLLHTRPRSCQQIKQLAAAGPTLIRLQPEAT
mgnify:CR=1 FL=1